MSEVKCSCCQKPKAPLNCGLCKDPVCKACANFLDEGQFSFLAHRPEELSYDVYCTTCFNSHVAEPLQAYNQLMEAAKEIFVFMKAQNKETHYIDRKETPLQVVDCADRDETLLRLAFFAAEAKFNAIIDVELKSKKIKQGSYQSTLWSGTAIPAHVQPEKLIKDRALRQNPN